MVFPTNPDGDLKAFPGIDAKLQKEIILLDAYIFIAPTPATLLTPVKFRSVMSAEQLNA